MLFLTPWFVLFACIVFPLYWSIRIAPVRLVLLYIACVVFHSRFAGPAGVLPIVVLGVATYLAGLTRKKALCLAAAGLSIAALVFYKYTRFLCLAVVGGVSSGCGEQILNHLGPLMPAAPPLAISFFVFEFVHYLYEVGHGSPPIKNPLEFSLFCLFWPSIVAGPVKRYGQFLPALKYAIYNLRSRDVAVGFVLLAVGLLKKFAADNLTAYIAYQDKLYPQLPMLERWYVFGALGLRILWDFSGYSDMAIGFAMMFGIRLPQNFNWPYLAMSITDFWRRWHISLSEWIRDYVYIPIGGSRCGPARKVLNGLIAFGLCGLWHGAAWNFLFWGVYHGIGLAISSNYRAILGRFGKAISDWLSSNRVVAWALTMLYVHVGWLFFFYPVPQAYKFLVLLFKQWV
jgi:alginate O-acetyltransferase complex protein AlgI